MLQNAYDRKIGKKYFQFNINNHLNLLTVSALFLELLALPLAKFCLGFLP
jgi:hypothetical protein